MKSSTKTITETITAVSRLPTEDRIGLLMATIIGREGEAVACAMKMLGAISYLAERFTLTDKVKMAEVLRDAADDVEHRHAGV